MRDNEYNELHEGWYWYSDSREGDIFHPAYFKDDKFLVDKRWYPASDFENLSLDRAIMPDTI